MSTITEFLVKYNGDSKDFQQADAKVNDSLEKTDTAATKTSGSFGKSMGKIGKSFAVVGAAAVAAAGAIFKFTDNMSKQLDEIDKGSQKMGVSAEAYQEWSQIMQLGGSSVEALEKGTKQLALTAVEAAAGSEKYADAYRMLNVELNDADGTMRSQESIMADTIKGLSAMEDETTRNALASQLFGRAGQELIPVLNMGSEAIQKEIDLMRESGSIMSGDAVKAGADFQDMMTRVTTTLKAQAMTIGADLMPVITQLIDEVLPPLIEIIKSFVPMLKPIVDIAMTFITQLTPFITTLLDSVKPIIPLFAQLASSLLEGILPPLLKILEKLLPPIIKLLEMILPYVIKMLDAILPILGDLVDSLLPVFVELLEALMPILEPILEILTLIIVDLLVPMLKWIIDKGLKPIIGLVTQFAKLIGDSVPKIKEWISGVVDSVKALWETFTNMFSGVKEAMGGFIEAAQEKFGEMSTSVTVMFSNLKTTIVDTWDNIKEAAAQSMEDMKSRFGPLLEKGSEVAGKLKDVYVQTWVDIVEFIKTAIVNISKTFEKLWENITGAIQTIKTKFISSIKDFIAIGKDILQGIIQGMIDAVGGIGKWIKQICGDIVDGFKDFFGIKSPSVLAAEEIGEPILAGILKPIEKIGATLKDVLGKQMKQVKDTFFEAGRQSVEALNSGVESAVEGTKKSVEGLVNVLQKVPDLSFLSNIIRKEEVVIAHEGDGVITEQQDNKLHVYAHVSEEFEEDLQKLSGAIASSTESKDDSTFQENLIYYLQQIQYTLETKARSFEKVLKSLFTENLQKLFDTLIKALHSIYEKEELKFDMVIQKLDILLTQWRVSFENLMLKIDKFYEDLEELLQDGLTDIIKAIAEAVETIGDYLREAAKTISDTISSIGGTIIKYLLVIVGLLQRLLDNIQMVIKELQQLKNKMIGGGVDGVPFPENGDDSGIGLPWIPPGDPRYGDVVSSSSSSQVINQNRYVQNEYNIIRQNHLFSHPGDLALMGYKS